MPVINCQKCMEGTILSKIILYQISWLPGLFDSLFLSTHICLLNRLGLQNASHRDYKMPVHCQFNSEKVSQGKGKIFMATYLLLILLKF